MATILATSGGRLARAQLEPRLGTPAWEELLAEVRGELRRHLFDGVLLVPGATWLVTASTP